MATTVELVRELDGWRDHAALYKLSSPVGFARTWDGDGNRVIGHTKYVVVSAVDFTTPLVGRIHETYIFPSDENANITGWCELPGSVRNTTSHKEALDGLIRYIDAEEED